MYLHFHYNKSFAEFSKGMHRFGSVQGFDDSASGTSVITIMEAKQSDVASLQSMDAVTLIPTHTSADALSDTVVSVFAKHGAKKGDKPKDLLDRLVSKFGAPWFNTANYYS